MKILVFCTHECNDKNHLWLVDDCVNFLKKNKFTTEEINLPFQNDPKKFLEQALVFRSFDLSSADLVITFGPFAHCIDHKNKISFVANHLKNFFELWGGPFGEEDSIQNKIIKNSVYEIDTKTLSEAKIVYTFYNKNIYRYPEVKMTHTKLPIIIPYSNFQKVYTEKVNILIHHNFNHYERFENLIYSLDHIENKQVVMKIIGTIERQDIYDSILRIGKTQIESERLIILPNPSPKELKDEVSISDLIVDCGIESDTLPLALKYAHEFKTPFFGIEGCGILDELTNHTQIENIIPDNHFLISRFINNFFSNHIKNKKKFDTYFHDYYLNQENLWKKIII